MVISSSRSLLTLPLVISLLTCCIGQARTETIGELYEKAKQEKTLVLYGAGPTGSHDR
jgi:hypothetical protein